MKSLKETVRERELRRTGGTPENAAFHSKNYRRYFEGWSEYRETDETGKTVIRRVYTGVLHRADIPDARWKLLRILYPALWLLSIALFFLAASRPVPSNSAVYATIPQALSVAGFAYLGWSLFNYITSGREMTLHEFRSTAAVKKSAGFTALCLFSCGILTLLHSVMARSEASELPAAALFLLAGAVCAAVRQMEASIRYESFLSKEEAPNDASQITS